jgi:hypothetical protein
MPRRLAGIVLLTVLPLLAWAQAVDRSKPTPACEQALQAYTQMKSRSTMEPSQYPLTAEGMAVRSACGPQALPEVDPAALTPPRPHAHARASAPARAPAASRPAAAASTSAGRRLAP